MIGPNFMDEIDCGSFFDHIDDLLEFPQDDATNGLTTSTNDCNAFPSIWTNPSEGLPGCDSVFSGNSSSDLSAELSVPYEDMIQLEWLSNFVEDSFSGGCTAFQKENLSLDNKELTYHPSQTSSPVSVLESSSSCSGGKNLPPSPDCDVLACGKPGRARSKRPRPAAFSLRLPFQLLSPASSVGETPTPQVHLMVAPNKVSSESESFADSYPPRKIPKSATVDHQKKKKKKIKLLVPLVPEDTNQNPPSQSVRKCQHCEITKTPQWRAGPMGPKTLCNACGVRFKSGRLFPEYRPAASPTFVPSLHSNSHKKVTEMRGKVSETSPLAGAGTAVGAVATTAATTLLEIVTNGDVIADCM